MKKICICLLSTVLILGFAFSLSASIDDSSFSDNEEQRGPISYVITFYNVVKDPNYIEIAIDVTCEQLGFLYGDVYYGNTFLDYDSDNNKYDLSIWTYSGNINDDVNRFPVESQRITHYQVFRAD